MSTESTGQLNDYQKRKIFVGGLSLNTTSEELTQHFEHYGAVVSAQVSKDFSKKDIQHNSGYGFVEFSTIEGCKKALSLPRQMINGKLCDVREYHWKGSTKVKSEEKPKEAVDIRKILTQKFGKVKTETNSYAENKENDPYNQRSQIKNLEMCMASLQQLNMNKSVEIEKLSKEVEKLKREKNILNEKVEEYESLLKEVHNALLNESKDNSGLLIPECCICNENRVDTAIVPCGHYCLCFGCSNLPNFANKKCPICHKEAGIIKMLL